jgi:hypothetical protein
LKPTALGRRFLNDLQALFLNDAARTRATKPAVAGALVRTPAVP